MRKLLEVSDQNLIPLSEEVEMLEMYLNLESVRFGDEFHYELKLDASLKKSETKIPSLLIQPYVENAVKHGLFHLRGEKKLNISIKQTPNDALKISVADNGIGREAAAEYRKPNHRSFGTKANATRLDLLNSSRKRPITVAIEDSFFGNRNIGTTVTIIIPLETVENG
jgi:LytS/YehU family sensor histidine kinase